jgi:hypothetical protein
MRSLIHFDRYRVRLYGEIGDAFNGYFILPNPNQLSALKLKVIASNGGGWDHVSVSTCSRCPTWDEMAWIREKFFEPDEIPVQFGIGRNGSVPYVNNHPYCLHWWRAHHVLYPLPPIAFV